MDNSVNFKGTFLVKPTSVRAKVALIERAGERCKILEHLSRKGDLFVVKHENDKEMAKYIYANNMPFEYYPTLSIRSGFSSRQYGEARKILLDHSAEVIYSRRALDEHFGGSLKNEVEKAVVNDALKAVKLDPNMRGIKLSDGSYKIVKGKNKQPVGYISPRSLTGRHYVYIKSTSPDEDPKMYSVIDGKIEKPYTSITQFKKLFADTIKLHNGDL